VKNLKQNNFYILLLVIFLNGCNDNAQITKYTDTQTQPTCLRLVVFPSNELITNTLTKLYSFTNNCDYDFQVSTKSGIVCNSNQNANKKALTNFPSGYLRMDVNKGKKPVYSYYKDVYEEITEEDIQNAFYHLKDDLLKESN